MDIAMIGLGKMGANMTRRLLQAGHRVVGFDVRLEAVEAIQQAGAEGVTTWSGLGDRLPSPRVVWVMVPSGEPTDDTLHKLAEVLAAGDIIIDGGNNNYRQSMRRAGWLEEQGLHFVDVGTSGGVWGLSEGYSLMVGGDKAVVERLRPIFEALAPDPEEGWGHVGPVGAGHFVKMIHNGIEYGLMEAYAEGFELLQHKTEFELDLHQVPKSGALAV